MGRPGKSALTPEVHNIIIQYIKAGSYISVAAQAAGISHATFCRWMKRGEKEKSSKYAKFVKAIKKAEAESEQHAVTIVRKAMGTSWQAAMTWLERKHARRWARQEIQVQKEELQDADTVAEAIREDEETAKITSQLLKKVSTIAGNGSGNGKVDARRFSMGGNNS